MHLTQSLRRRSTAWPAALLSHISGRVPKPRVWLQRGLVPDVEIDLRVVWPLYVVPFLLLSQLLTPHPVWVTLSLAICGLYIVGYYWVRVQAGELALERKREGTLIVVGDSFREEYELANHSSLPLLWAELSQQSEMPDYQVKRVIATGANSTYRWTNQVECRRRGLYQIGPFTLHSADPFGIFELIHTVPITDTVLIYPRVAKMPSIALPPADAAGANMRRRSLRGTHPASSVREYRRGDSLRYIHWRMTAHRGQIIVKERELEPSGDVWIVVDQDAERHWDYEGESSLEFAIIAAASFAAQLTEGDQRAVGLLAVETKSNAGGEDEELLDLPVTLAPQSGRSQLWQVMARLAPLQASTTSLADLLRSGRDTFGRRNSLLVITPVSRHDDATSDPDDWIAELLHLQSTGIGSSVILILGGDPADLVRGEQIRDVLSRVDVAVLLLPVDMLLESIMTYRRTRIEIVSTPTGGAVRREVQEEVG